MYSHDLPHLDPYGFDEIITMLTRYDLFPIITYIYILIALALDESIILDVPQFPMQNIYQSCDLGRAIGRRNVNASQ